MTTDKPAWREWVLSGRWWWWMTNEQLVVPVDWRSPASGPDRRKRFHCAPLPFYVSSHVLSPPLFAVWTDPLEIEFTNCCACAAPFAISQFHRKKNKRFRGFWAQIVAPLICRLRESFKFFNPVNGHDILIELCRSKSNWIEISIFNYLIYQIKLLIARLSQSTSSKIGVFVDGIHSELEIALYIFLYKTL